MCARHTSYTHCESGPRSRYRLSKVTQLRLERTYTYRADCTPSAASVSEAAESTITRHTQREQGLTCLSRVHVTHGTSYYRRTTEPSSSDSTELRAHAHAHAHALARHVVHFAQHTPPCHTVCVICSCPSNLSSCGFVEGMPSFRPQERWHRMASVCTHHPQTPHMHAWLHSQIALQQFSHFIKRVASIIIQVD